MSRARQHVFHGGISWREQEVRPYNNSPAGPAVLRRSGSAAGVCEFALPGFRAPIRPRMGPDRKRQDEYPRILQRLLRYAGILHRPRLGERLALGQPDQPERSRRRISPIPTPATRAEIHFPSLIRRPRMLPFRSRALTSISRSICTTPIRRSGTLSLQRQLSKDWLASASYIGDKGTHYRSSIEGNPALFAPALRWPI